MEVIVCLDDRNGMMFNHRRQSQDRKVIEDILRCLKEKRLLINSFSASLFDNTNENILIKENPLVSARENDICFIENFPLMPYVEKIKRLTIYLWNRRYPADTYLDMDLNNSWRMLSRAEFTGYSHKKITKETYTR